MLGREDSLSLKVDEVSRVRFELPGLPGGKSQKLAAARKELALVARSG